MTIDRAMDRVRACLPAGRRDLRENRLNSFQKLLEISKLDQQNTLQVTWCEAKDFWGWSQFKLNTLKENYV